MTLGTFLLDAERKLLARGCSSPRLDAQLIAQHVLGKDRSWLLAHNEHNIDSTLQRRLEDFVTKRAERQPLAYLLGVQEFFGRRFDVSPNVLIPRPETEQLITQLLALGPKPGNRLLDVGTGSGAIAITAKLELPFLNVTATDISRTTLHQAQHNAKKLDATLTFLESDLLKSVPAGEFRFIMANLPYVGKSWETSPETAYEPQHALFANQNGLQLIFKLLDQVPTFIAQEGFLLLEADPRQHPAIIERAVRGNFKLKAQSNFSICLQKTTPNKRLG